MQIRCEIYTETFKKIHRAATKRVPQLSIDRIVENARSAKS